MTDLHLAIAMLIVGLIWLKLAPYRLNDSPRHIAEHHCSSMCGCRGAAAAGEPFSRSRSGSGGGLDHSPEDRP